jgi:hypothetical protein
VPFLALGLPGASLLAWLIPPGRQGLLAINTAPQNTEWWCPSHLPVRPAFQLPTGAVLLTGLESSLQPSPAMNSQASLHTKELKCQVAQVEGLRLKLSPLTAVSTGALANRWSLDPLCLGSALPTTVMLLQVSRSAVFFFFN